MFHFCLRGAFSRCEQDFQLFQGNANKQQGAVDGCFVTGYLSGCVAALHKGPVLVLASSAGLTND